MLGRSECVFLQSFKCGLWLSTSKPATSTHTRNEKNYLFKFFGKCFLVVVVVVALSFLMYGCWIFKYNNNIFYVDTLALSLTVVRS